MNRPPASAGISKAPTKPRRRDPRGTRERVARAALELFTTQGYHPSTTPQIADRAGVAEGTIYRHFQSKEQLLNEVYRSAVRLFIDVVREAPVKGSCRDRTTVIATRWREVASRDAALVKLVFVSPPQGLLDAKSRETYQELRTELERVLASGKASGEVRAGPVELWTDVWLQLVTLTLARVADNEWAPDHSAPRLVDESAWDAVAARANPSPQ
jgi:AcrR family transcriptional regulator